MEERSPSGHFGMRKKKFFEALSDAQKEEEDEKKALLLPGFKNERTLEHM